MTSRKKRSRRKPINPAHKPITPAQSKADARPTSTPGDPRLRALDELDRLRTQLEQATQRQKRAVQRARDTGASWHQIGLAMGTTAQGAHKRFRRPPSSPTEANP